MRTLHMVLQVAVSEEVFGAMLALKWPGVCVRAKVLIQASLPVECLGAVTVVACKLLNVGGSFVVRR